MLSAELTAWYHCVLPFFHSICLKYCACHKKVRPGHTKCCTSRKMILANLKIGRSKMQPLSRNLRSDLLTSLMNMSLVLRLPREMHLCRSSSNVPRLPLLLKLLQNPHALLTFGKVPNPLQLPRKTTSKLPKVVRTRQFLTLLTSKCASRHDCVHSFDISTSKKCSDVGVFCAF